MIFFNHIKDYNFLFFSKFSNKLELASFHSNIASSFATRLILFSFFKKLFNLTSNKSVINSNIFTQNSFDKNIIFFLLEINFFKKIEKSLIFHFLVTEFKIFQKKIKYNFFLTKNISFIQKEKNNFFLILYLSKLDFFIFPRLSRKWKILERKKEIEAKKQLALKLKKEKEEWNQLKQKLHKELYYKFNKRTKKYRYNPRPHPKHVQKVLKKFAILRAELEKKSPLWKRRVNYIPFLFFRKLVNVSTKRGLQKKALKIFIESLSKARRELNLKISRKRMLALIYKRLNPLFVLRKFNLGRRIILIPLPLRKEKKISVISRLFVNAVKQRSGVSFADKLVDEFKEFFLKNKKPASVRAKELRIRTAIANKSNLRFMKVRKKRRR